MSSCLSDRLIIVQLMLWDANCQYAEGAGKEQGREAFTFDRLKGEINRLHEPHASSDPVVRRPRNYRMIQRAYYRACQPTQRTPAMQGGRILKTERIHQGRMPPR